MTPQEQQLLQDLCARLTLTQGQPKDAQADAELRRGLSNAPDALYWLAQRTLMLEQAIQQAQQQIGELEQQLKQAQQSQSQSQSQGAGSFLSGGLGTHFGRAPERYAEDGGYAANAQPPYQPQYQPQAAPQPSSWRDRFFGGGSAPRAAAPQAYGQPATSAGSSFLGNAAAAAAGVAGGMFLFNGLENLMGGHHAGSGSQSGGSDSKSLAQDSSSQGLHGDSGNTSSLANDAGLGSIDSADNDSWGDGGGFFDDDFA
ncbi:DUF2076 domain-containing protein [Comamonas testosteroni]|uniref:ABC transporter substrate-binding protein n=1 Tax=Comamonas testosteroni TaxID=285 RepID=A0A096HTQ0_COMTE|nr:DUF2076 domain-containing protein [Comamonas testosteroni]KGH32352.1 ABC transporter substrate-binding protein [Comamonas testosteroni]